MTVIIWMIAIIISHH